MIDANAYSLATNWALHEIKAQIRDTNKREIDFQTSDLRNEAKRYLNDHPEMLAQAELMIASHSTFMNLRKKGAAKSAAKAAENQRR